MVVKLQMKHIQKHWKQKIYIHEYSVKKRLFCPNIWKCKIIKFII